MIERLRKRMTIGEREGGFTLIELLVVIIIIGILLAIAVPSYLGFKKRAEDSTAKANLRAGLPAVEAFYADNGTYAGMDATDLVGIDQAWPAVDANGDGVTIVSVAADDYCLRSDQGNSDSFYKDGPGGVISTTACT
jgi:type IV pilus assembly protein PilA